jgi:hypothetical protein
MSVGKSWMAEIWSFIDDILVATRHVSVNATTIFDTPVSSVGYALITCCGEDEMKTRMKRRLPSRPEEGWKDGM